MNAHTRWFTRNSWSNMTLEQNKPGDGPVLSAGCTCMSYVLHRKTNCMKKMSRLRRQSLHSSCILRPELQDRSCKLLLQANSVVICTQVEWSVEPVSIRNVVIFKDSLTFDCHGEYVLNKYTTFGRWRFIGQLALISYCGFLHNIQLLFIHTTGFESETSNLFVMYNSKSGRLGSSCWVANLRIMSRNPLMIGPDQPRIMNIPVIIRKEKSDPESAQLSSSLGPVFLSKGPNTIKEKKKIFFCCCLFVAFRSASQKGLTWLSMPVEGPF